MIESAQECLTIKNKNVVDLMTMTALKVVVESDKGAISSVIQTTNQSRVPSSRPRTVVRPKGEDTRLDPEHKLEQKC